MKRIAHYIACIGLLLAIGCLPPEKEVITTINLDLADDILQKIYTFQDTKNIDSLYRYFRADDPTYRYTAAMAFASIQEEKALDSLGVLLKTDPIQRVRTAAAYAIGQTGAKKGEALLIRGFRQMDTLGLSEQSNGAILEAIGKCGTKKSLEFLSTISTYTEKDTILLEGQARGIYRYMLRDIILPEGTNRMLQLVYEEKYPSSARMMAANYLGRIKKLEIDSTQAEILTVLLGNEENANIRMALALALGKTENPMVIPALQNQFAQEKDYRVRCNIIRALSKFDYPDVQATVFQALSDKNESVTQVAAQFFVQNGEARDAAVYWRRARDSVNMTMLSRIALYEAANRHTDAFYKDTKWLINNSIKQIWEDTLMNPYYRANSLKALGEYEWNYTYIYDEGIKHENPVFRTAAMEALAKICRNPKIQRESRKRIKRKLKSYLSEAINEGEAGVKAIAADILTEKKLGFMKMFENSSFLHVAKRGLQLPKETETAYALQRAINAFERKETKNKVPDFNHPIDWKQLNGISTASKASIKTAKGTIVLQLLPIDAPGSVANFIQLAKDGFYNNKNFHRVVANFVIQGGCPRGDGYGALDYSIRTEAALRHYDEEGYVGMASAGPDTEGTQWFITHSPTPHLDGKYTIFAKVVEGMDVVHQLQISDRIESVEIL